MDAVELSTVVYVPREEAFEFLLDFTNHERYSEYVADVTRRGDGSVGTRFDVTLRWWQLTYTLTPAVTVLDRPDRIDWRIPDDVHARGYWALESVEAQPDGSTAAADGGGNRVDDDRPATRIRLRIEFDRRRSRLGRLRLPPLVSTDWVLRRIKPLAAREAREVFERAVADLEGERRRVDLEFHDRPSTI
ncbi:SRPBCC family protein [Haloarchaeobius baliensis]|uniref:SRPBCC family protein n=1 Tax=Haloarchaeobius baliensis TaxID=1670458 RepID=UPI003F8819F2